VKNILKLSFASPFLLCFALAAQQQAPITQLGPLIGSPAQGAVVHRATVSDLLFSAPRLSGAERHNLGPLDHAERLRLSTPEAGSGSRALKVGVVRELRDRIGFDGLTAGLKPGESRANAGGLLENSGGNHIWTTAIRSEGAGALRLQLDGALPDNARAFIYNALGEVHGPYTGAQLAQKPFWTNTVYSDEAFLEVQILGDPAGARIHVVSVAHIEHERFAPTAPIAPAGTECFRDATCITTSEFANIDLAAKAVAQLIFVSGGSTFVCSGGLLNNTNQDGTPYFLTANHCFETQSAASSLEATWNYRTTSCSDPNLEPNRALFPRSLGSTLLATNASSDFTFVRLNQNPPSNAVLLGWDAVANIATSGGTKLFRLHHPEGLVQFYTRQGVNTTSGTCTSSPRGDFIYSNDELGGTAGGSSGSVAMLANLQVVGQLKGACGSNLEDDCDSINNRTVDGAFRTTFPSIQQFLAPGGGGTPLPCVASNTTACMLGNRFKVTVRYRGTFDNNPADTNALVKQVTGFANPAFETGFFFFNDPNNIEMLVKLLDQGNTNGQGQRTIAVLFGSATPLRLEVTLTDTVSGAIKQYVSEFGQMRGTTDFTAFVK
jgi:hypothetical protein